MENRSIAALELRPLEKKQLLVLGLPRWLSGKESAWQGRRCKRCRFDPWVGKISWTREWQPTLVFLPGEFHGQRSLAGCIPWGCKESDTTEHTCFWKKALEYQFLFSYTTER